MKDMPWTQRDVTNKGCNLRVNLRLNVEDKFLTYGLDLKSFSDDFSSVNSFNKPNFFKVSVKTKQCIDANRAEKEEGGKSGTQKRCKTRTAGHTVSRWLLSPALSGHQAYLSLACILDSSNLAALVTLIFAFNLNWIHHFFCLLERPL